MNISETFQVGKAREVELAKIPLEDVEYNVNLGDASCRIASDASPLTMI